MLIAYFAKFGSKPCCASDLKLYVPTLEASEVNRFIDETLTFIPLDGETNAPRTEADVTRHVCWFALNRLVGKHHPPAATIEDRSALVENLCSLYESAQDLFTDFLPTVVHPNNFYIEIAAHILWELWHETSEDKYFWKAVVHLHTALNISPASHNLRILLVKFFNQIGAVGASYLYQTGLELKHVQLDSLGYLLSRHIQTCAHFNTASSMFSSTIKFFTSNYKDVSIIYLGFFSTSHLLKITLSDY